MTSSVSRSGDDLRATGPVAVLMVIASCTILQSGAALAIHLFEQLGPWGTSGLRVGLAAIILLVVTRPPVHRFTWEQWRIMLVFGVILGLMNGVFYASLDRIPLGTAVAVEFLGPLTVAALLSARRSDMLWVVLAAGGVGLFGLEPLLGTARLDPVGVLLALVAGVFWGLYVLCSAKVGALVPGQSGLGIAMTVGALILLPLGGRGVIEGLTDVRLLGLALGTALLSSVLPYSLELAALRRMPRNVFGVLLSLEPVIALLAGVMLLGQDLSALKVLAASLVMSASVGVTLTARAPQPQGAGGEVGAEEEHSLLPGYTLTGEIPAITHATVTGEMQALRPEDLEDPPGAAH